MTSRTERVPERRWWRRWERGYRASGGWAGPRTLAVQRGRALSLFGLGATAEAAGAACAEQYRLRSALDDAREMLAGREGGR